MEVGLLWYDDDPARDLAEKVGRAARRYRQKFGASPDICYVHPSALGGNGKGQGARGRKQEVGDGKQEVRRVGGVRVIPLPTVLRHHFWIGREEKRRRRSD